MLGGVIGLMLGVVLGYGRDRLDDRIRDESRLKSLIGDVPVLGRIPFDTRKQPARPAALVEPRSPVSEAFRALNTNLRFLAAARSQGRPSQVGEILVVTSALTGEGKTTVAGNLAVTAAEPGCACCWSTPTFANLPSARCSASRLPPVSPTCWPARAQSARRHRASPTSGSSAPGPSRPNPAELLASPRAATIWQQLRQQADLVGGRHFSGPERGYALGDDHHADWVLLTVRNRQSREHQLPARWSGCTGSASRSTPWCGRPDRGRAVPTTDTASSRTRTRTGARRPYPRWGPRAPPPAGRPTRSNSTSRRRHAATRIRAGSGVSSSAGWTYAPSGGGG